MQIGVDSRSDTSKDCSPTSSLSGGRAGPGAGCRHLAGPGPLAGAEAVSVKAAFSGATVFITGALALLEAMSAPKRRKMGRGPSTTGTRTRVAGRAVVSS